MFRVLDPIRDMCIGNLMEHEVTSHCVGGWVCCALREGDCGVFRDAGTCIAWVSG